MQTAADVLVDSLVNWGAGVVFGMPGDGITGIIEALERQQDRIRFIQVRNEESASIMACGYAKFSGKLGVCLGSSGPGGIHLLNGLYDAKMDGQPVLAITGTQFHDMLDTFGQQDVALDRLFMDVALYNTRIMGPAHVENVANLACRAALSLRGVAHITFSVDIQTKEAPAQRSVLRPLGNSSSMFAQRARLPYEGDLRAAAEVLNNGKKIAILAGRGALDAASELEYLAEILGAPVIKALGGKAALPDDSPYTTGGLGPLGTRPSLQAMQACDTLLMVGTSFPYIEFLPEPGQANAVQIDMDPTRIGLRYPVQIGLVGDTQRTFKLLLPLLERHLDRSFLEAAQHGAVKWKEQIEKVGSGVDTPLKPQVAAWELGKFLAENAMLAVDSGSVVAWWANYIPVKLGQLHALSGNLASIGCGLPYAIAAQVAFPDRPSVAFVGDGGFSMSMAEFATCVKYNLPVRVILMKDNRIGQSKGAHHTPASSREISYSLQPIDFVAYARACGGMGIALDNPEDCQKVFEKAFSADCPVLVEVNLDSGELPQYANTRKHSLR